MYYDGTVATSYLHGTVSSQMSLLVTSEADNSDKTEQVEWQHLVYNYRSHTFNALAQRICYGCNQFMQFLSAFHEQEQ